MCDFRTGFNYTMVAKIRKLIEKSGFEELDLKGKFVAIKIHFGEPGNFAYLRPQYVRILVDYVKERGGKPFLTDCNTLYVGGRKNALDHLESAYLNGFAPYATGCHVIIADGLKGTDEVNVPVENGIYVKEAKIGRAVMDADVFISVTHFKAHENTGVGGVLKNIGMGCGSRAGKMEMHSAGKPKVVQEACIGCGACAKVCGSDAIGFTDKKALINRDICTGCGRCIGVCPKDAVVPLYDEKNDILNEKISEYTAAVLKGRPHYHISFVMDVSPYCDCHAENDAPIIPDVGVFASFDPVALDQACTDSALKMPVAENSLLSERKASGNDHFKNLHPTTNWQVMMDSAQRLGLGNKDYELIKIT